MPRIPLLIFSDAPSGTSGLARITRDLVTRLNQKMSDVFRVATVGYGSRGSSKIPCQQYSWTFNDEFIIHDLPELWEDFAGTERGIFMSIQDPGRMLWLARPEAACSDERVAKWLMKAPFERWGYFPIDATCTNDKLSLILRECLMGYDRILAYTNWSAELITRSIGETAALDRKLSHLPHGIDTKVFYPRNRESCRARFGELTCGRRIPISSDELLVGIVATNQARKDYGLAIHAFKEICKRGKAKLWIHTDALDRYWSIPYLLADYGVQAIATLNNLSDDVMAQLYSACDVTMLPSSEGFGYPIFESLACGTPCIHGDYAGAAEFLPDKLKVKPIAYRQEGVYGCVRPVFNAEEWAKRAIDSTADVKLPSDLDWTNLWPRWEAWFRKGVESTISAGAGK